jgi:hypothetical protein
LHLQHLFLPIDGKLWTEKLAEPATHAAGAVSHYRWVIPLGVIGIGHNEHPSGAEFDAETASFAALLQDVNDTMRNPNPRQV